MRGDYLNIDICEIARAIERGGKDLDSAIPIAVSRCEVWSTGKGVNKATQVKAAAAIAEWNEKKARADAKGAVKKAKVAASCICDSILSRGEEVLLRLCLSGYAPRDGLTRLLSRVSSSTRKL